MLRNLVGLDEADARLAHLGGGVLAGVHDEESRRRVGVDETHGRAVEESAAVARLDFDGVDAALPFDDQVDLGAGLAAPVADVVQHRPE